jgi:hypothetical protein
LYTENKKNSVPENSTASSSSVVKQYLHGKQFKVKDVSHYATALTEPMQRSS